MKRFVNLILLFICISSYSQDENLMLHYDFSNVEDNIVADVSGNAYDAELFNFAYVDQMGEFNILNLGFSNGYLNLGQKTGDLINTLQDFSVSTFVCVSEGANLAANGNFIWSFSNSDDIINDQNGCLFFSAKVTAYAISPTDYRAESGIQLGTPMVKKTWKHVVYTQAGYNAKIYIDGTEVKSGSVNLFPKILGKTTKNYIGRSPYLADDFFKGLIADFRIYNKALSASEINSLASGVSSMNENLGEYLNKPVRIIAEGNPLFKHRFTADPAALVHKDTFYIYSGEDTGNGSGYNMPNWTVFSSTDMETWEEHPIPLKTSDFKWAQGNNSWASQVIERNGKYYWYVSTEHSSIHGKAIGVAVSNSPTGPFKDARGSALITNNMTTQWTNISWDDIDPTVWVDDDGQAYLFWGNSQCYYAKLKENMIELDSEIMPVKLLNFTEAPWIHKRGEWYYISYASGFPEKTSYAMSRSINGPWEYKGILNELSGNSNTNHQAIVEFKDKWYFVYHNGGVQPNGGSYLRSVCIDYLYYNSDSTLKRVQMTTEGVDKVESTIVVSAGKKVRIKGGKIKVFPNPSDSLLTIVFPDLERNYNIKVYDNEGKLFYTKKFVNTNTEEIDLSLLHTGQYFIKCIDDSGLQETINFIKL